MVLAPSSRWSCTCQDVANNALDARHTASEFKNLRASDLPGPNPIWMLEPIGNCPSVRSVGLYRGKGHTLLVAQEILYSADGLSDIHLFKGAESRILAGKADGLRSGESDGR